MLMDMMPARLLRSNVSFLKIIVDAYFHTMEGLSAQLFVDNAENSRSRTFTFTTCATKAQAGFSKQAFLLSRSLSLLGIRIGKCCAVIHTSSRSICTSLPGEKRSRVRSPFRRHNLHY